MQTKTFFSLCIIMGIAMTQLFAQTLKRGNVLSVRSFSITLQPDVTMNQFIDFYINKYIPEWEKNHPGIRLFLLGGDRGEKKNQIGILWYFESLEVRDKYWPIADSKTPTDNVKEANEKMKDLFSESSKYVLSATSVYTDWLIK